MKTTSLFKTAAEKQAYESLKDQLLKARTGDPLSIPQGLSIDLVNRAWQEARGAKLDAAAERAGVEMADAIGDELAKLDPGRKDDSDKTPLHLLPVDALQAITEILDFGAKKYAPRNWEKGMDWHRLYRATLGHLFAWWSNAGPDAETGKSHLWHAGCCILFLISYELRSVGNDDRPSI